MDGLRREAASGSERHGQRLVAWEGGGREGNGPREGRIRGGLATHVPYDSPLSANVFLVVVLQHAGNNHKDES